MRCEGFDYPERRMDSYCRRFEKLPPWLQHNVTVFLDNSRTVVHLAFLRLRFYKKATAERPENITMTALHSETGRIVSTNLFEQQRVQLLTDPSG